MDRRLEEHFPINDDDTTPYSIKVASDSHVYLIFEPLSDDEDDDTSHRPTYSFDSLSASEQQLSVGRFVDLSKDTEQAERLNNIDFLYDLEETRSLHDIIEAVSIAGNASPDKYDIVDHNCGARLVDLLSMLNVGIPEGLIDDYLVPHLIDNGIAELARSGSDSAFFSLFPDYTSFSQLLSITDKQLVKSIIQRTILSNGGWMTMTATSEDEDGEGTPLSTLSTGSVPVDAGKQRGPTYKGGKKNWRHAEEQEEKDEHGW